CLCIVLMARILVDVVYMVPAITKRLSLSLHDALPISCGGRSTSASPPPRAVATATEISSAVVIRLHSGAAPNARNGRLLRRTARDRKSTRLNSSHDQSSYAVFCLK